MGARVLLVPRGLRGREEKMVQTIFLIAPMERATEVLDLKGGPEVRGEMEEPEVRAVS